VIPVRKAIVEEICLVRGQVDGTALKFMQKMIPNCDSFFFFNFKTFTHKDEHKILKKSRILKIQKIQSK